MVHVAMHFLEQEEMDDLLLFIYLSYNVILFRIFEVLEKQSATFLLFCLKVHLLSELEWGESLFSLVSLSLPLSPPHIKFQEIRFRPPPPPASSSQQ